MGPGAFRFLLASLVVGHHCLPLRMGAWAVYVFFILSGYWIALMWDEKYKQTELPLITFLVSRWLRLAPVFFFTLAAAYLSGLFVPGAPKVPDPLWEWVLRQVPIVGAGSAGLILPPVWSLDVEMRFYLAWAVGMALAQSRMRGPVVCIGSAAALLSFFAMVIEIRNGVIDAGSSSLKIYLWLFALGVALRLTRWVPGIYIGRIALTVFVGGCLVLLAIPATRSLIWMAGRDANALNQSFLWIIQSWWLFGAVLVIPWIAWNVRRPTSTWDRMLGDWAYPLYLFHWMSRDAYYALVVDGSGPAWRIAMLVANLVVAFGGSWLIWRYIDKPLNAARARWVAGRLSSDSAKPGHLASHVSES